MIDDTHYKQRQFAVQLTRTVLRGNPHLLVVNYFLHMPESSGDDYQRFPAIRLVYGMAKREAPNILPVSWKFNSEKEI